MSVQYTEEELAALSPTEREALTGDGADEDENTLADIAGDDDSDDDDDDQDGNGDSGADNADDKAGDVAGDDASDKAADDAGAIDDKASDDQATDTASEFDLADVPAVNFVPRLSGEILPQYQAKIDELSAKLEDGEISQVEWFKEANKLQAQSQNEEIGNQLWAAEQAAFFKANPSYTQKDNPVLWGTLNQEVIRMANDPNNAGLSGIQTLYLAKANVEKAFRAMFPGTKAEPDKKPASVKPVVPPKPAAKRPDGHTLRDVPAADSPEVGQDKFAHLDKLSGEKLEAAIARMTPEEQQEYLRGA